MARRFRDVGLLVGVLLRLLATCREAAAAECGECGGARRCDDWQPDWPGGERDSYACTALLSKDSQAQARANPLDEWCSSVWAAAHCHLTCCRSGHEPRLEPTPGAPLLTVVHQVEKPVIDTRATPGTEDNLFGFEGGRVFKQGGTYYYFAAEMFDFPVDANMRIALWKSPTPIGPWTRVSTMETSHQRYTQVAFEQQCNQPYCKWNNASMDRFRMHIEYVCDPSDLLGSPWAPFPIFDVREDRWHVLYVSYMCDGTWSVAAGGGNIFGARSATKGVEGIEGPYETYGIVIGPNATNPANRWGHEDHASPDYVMAIDPFVLPNGTLAAFVGEDHYLAIAESAHGPWRIAGNRPRHDVAISTPSSNYNENPVVTELRRPSGERVFVAVFDSVMSEHIGFGMTWSEDGLNWRPGVDVPLPGGCRTPLGLIDEGNGLATLLFTRRFADCHNQTMLPGNGADAISPASCANVYAATVAIDWQPRSDGSAAEVGGGAPNAAPNVEALLESQRVRALRFRLAALDSERAAIERELRQMIEANSGGLHV